MKKLAFVLLAIMILASFTAQAAERTRVGVLRFQSSAGVEGGYAMMIGDTFAQMLSLSDKLSVMGTEQMTITATQNNIPLSGYISRETAQEIGKLAGCKYVVVGTVTNFKRTAKSSGIWIAGSHKQESLAEADVRVYDTDTGDTVVSESASGRAAQSGSYVSIYGISSGQSDISGMDAGAIAEVTSKLSITVRDKLADDSPIVTAKTAKEVTLNLGTIGGAGKGEYYRIYSGSGRNEKNLAVVKVTDAKSDYSKAELAEKGMGNLSLVQKGDKIFPVDATELKDIQKKGFAKSRPKSSELSDNDILNSSPSAKTDSILTPSKSQSTPAVSGANFENESTDPAKVIASYGLPAGEENTLRLAHINAAKLGDKSRKAYNKYVELAEANTNDYLAAYRAGIIAKNLKKKKDAVKWLDKALEINPNYIPAQEAKSSL